MTNRYKIQVFDCVQYLINECQARVLIEHDEITVWHLKFDHTHVRLDDNDNVLGILRDIIMRIEKDEC